MLNPIFNWRVKRFTSDDEFRNFAQRARASLPITTINHDIEWLSLEHSWQEGELIVLADDSDLGIAGLAILSASSEPLEYAFGDFVFLTRSVPQFSMHQGPLSIRAESSEGINACLREIATGLPGAAVLCLKSIPTGSALHTAVETPSSALRRQFHVLPWGKETTYCRIRWEGCVETYLQSIGKETRRNLKRYSKKLFADPTIRPSVRRFASDQAEAFLAEAAPVFEKTWQKKQEIVRLDGTAERRIRFAAQRDSFLGYILYIDEQPAAYRYCFVYGHTAVMFQTGYDPAWASHRVSNVLFLEVLSDFERSGLPVTSLDFLPHITLFKLHTTNDKQPTRNYYLFRRTPTGTMQFATLAATERLSRSVGALLDRFELKAKAARFVREMFGPRRGASTEQSE